jgi:hypothetical protein
MGLWSDSCSSSSLRDAAGSRPLPAHHVSGGSATALWQCDRLKTHTLGPPRGCKKRLDSSRELLSCAHGTSSYEAALSARMAQPHSALWLSIRDTVSKSLYKVACREVKAAVWCQGSLLVAWHGDCVHESIPMQVANAVKALHSIFFRQWDAASKAVLQWLRFGHPTRCLAGHKLFLYVRSSLRDNLAVWRFREWGFNKDTSESKATLTPIFKWSTGMPSQLCMCLQ